MVPRFEGDILLPHWVPGPGVGAEQLRQWERFSAALKVHEEGHVEHGIQLSNALAQLSGMQAPSCGEVESKLKQRADDLIRSYSNVDVEYDRTTNHGATQGAVLNY
jgi:predicted secreted Zn-dependent protease